ncbi:MAG TPA: hypothetical protein VFK44_05795 [Bacillales bacterium]|nr:hypothetical protein [Bacillales bacterium]
MQEKIRRLEKELEKLQSADAGPPHIPTTIIETVNVENVYVDQLEHNNTFGALGIKSLEGKLNIGANYGVDRVPDAKQPNLHDKRNKTSAHKKKPSDQEGPAYHIRRRRQT